MTTPRQLRVTRRCTEKYRIDGAQAYLSALLARPVSEAWRREEKATWALKRSPHVYSKSQENFGYKVQALTRTRDDPRSSPLQWSRDELRAALSNYYPGVELTWSWKSVR